MVCRLFTAARNLPLTGDWHFLKKNTISWGNYEKAPFYTILLDLKHRNKSLWNGPAGGKLQRLPTSQDKSVFAYYREKDGQRVVVILNLSNKPRSVSLDATPLPAIIPICLPKNL
jgi:glycosidase